MSGKAQATSKREIKRKQKKQVSLPAKHTKKKTLLPPISINIIAKPQLFQKNPPKISSTSNHAVYKQPRYKGA
jgi:hypothetical protein